MRISPSRHIHGGPQDYKTNELGRKRMRKAAVYGTVMVVLATAVNLLHAVSHAGQGVLSLGAW